MPITCGNSSFTAEVFNSARRISMKLTVLTILILMLMAGLAMIQMDANTENQIQVTENQIQVLGETEMLTTIHIL